jgi:hypothetical protein
LKTITLDEGCLKRMKDTVSLQALDGRDTLALLRRRQGHTGKDSAAIDMDCAGSALAAVATLLCSDQTKAITKRLQ